MSGGTKSTGKSPVICRRATGNAYARWKLGVQFEGFVRTGSAGNQRVGDAQRRGDGARNHRRGRACRGRIDRQVDHIVVDEDGLEIKLAPEVVRLKEPVIYYHVAGYLLDARRGDLLRELDVSGQRIGRGEHGVAQCVSLVMVVIGDGDSAVGVGPATHRKVARCLEYQIAMQDTRAIYGALAVNRGVVAVVGADLIQQLSHGEDLAHGADEKMVIRLQIYQHGSAGGIDDPQSPQRAFVTGLVEPRLDVRRNIGAVSARSGAATATAADAGEGRRQKSKEES